MGGKADFGILREEGDSEAVLTDAMRASGVGSDFTPKASQLLPVISRMLDECVRPEHAVEWMGSRPHASEVARTYTEYRQRLKASNLLDFGFLLAIAVELLETKGPIAKQVRRVYPFVCVDEFQDTNQAQSRFLVQLVPAVDPNLFVVADDDQL